MATVTYRPTTDEDTDGTVKYDRTSGAYGYSKDQTGFSKLHAVNITGLRPSSTYHFAVVSSDREGNQVASPNGLFKTQKTPDYEDPTVSLFSFGEAGS